MSFRKIFQRIRWQYFDISLYSPPPMSFKIKDKRIDRAIIQLGLDPGECEIFYSPIAAWLWPAILLWTMGGLLTFPLVLHSRVMILIVLCWFCLGYLFSALLNCSFVLTPRQMLAINPNFPFGRRIVFDFEDITGIRIARPPFWHRVLIPFMIAGGKFVQIRTSTHVHICYCTELRLDAFDENFTAKSLDDLHVSLKNKGLNVEWALQD